MEMHLERQIREKLLKNPFFHLTGIFIRNPLLQNQVLLCGVLLYFVWSTHFYPPPPKVKKEMFNRHQFFSTNKQYVKIKLMQNETNCWSIFLVKTKYW